VRVFLDPLITAPATGGGFLFFVVDAVDGFGHHNSPEIPFSLTMERSFSAGPEGFFWPRSHFWIVETLVLRNSAKAAWLSLTFLLILTMVLGLNGIGLGRHNARTSLMVKSSTMPDLCIAFIVLRTISRMLLFTVSS